MLVQFSFGNFRSFKDQATLSMVAASKLQVDPELDAGNTFVARERPPLNLLSVAAIYGANASGKSNIALALQAFRRCVVNSANLGFEFAMPFFFFSMGSEEEPISFEITFLLSGVQYRYGFEVQAEEEQEILSEWLYRSVSHTETTLFERTRDQVKRGRHFPEGAALLSEGRIRRQESLFLSLSAQLGGNIASEIINYFRLGMAIVSGLTDKEMLRYTEGCLRNNRYKDEIIRLVKEADTGIPNIVVLEDEDINTPDGIEPDNISGETQDRTRENVKNELRVLTYHPFFDRNGGQLATMPVPMSTFESQGTKKLFAFAGPIMDTLERGAILFVDEMDARFHPLLTKALIRLFQSPETNKKNAQLIFITHDTNLLDPKQFRRDQIWFVEKDRFGASHLYSLADFKGVRKDAPFESDYISGRYGAIPFLGNLNRLFEPDDTADVTTPAEPAHAKA